MKPNRRDFIKLAGLAGAGIAVARLTGCTDRSAVEAPLLFSHHQTFNMSGYAAPKLETVRIGIIGIGNRGSGALRRHVRIEGVEITALADLDPARAARGREFVREYGHEPAVYSGGEDE